MPVQLVLLEDVTDLGKIGDRVRVADGYARNYLLPKKLAAPLTDANLRRLEARKLRLQAERAERFGVAQTLAEKIARMQVTIVAQATDNKLYGSIGTAQIAEALEKEGITIDRHDIKLDEPIRETGEFSIDVQLHPEVKTAFKLWVSKA